MKVVITQSMLFPWVGMLEQIKLADILIHYDDVTFSKGSFTNRVQIKTLDGLKWLTIPLSNFKIGQKINEVQIDQGNKWKKKHLSMLEQNFSKTPFKDDALDIVNDVYKKNFRYISDLSKASMMRLCEYFNIDKKLKIKDILDLRIDGSSSKRVLETVKKVGGKTYITGHGAMNYLDHSIFEKDGIKVKYMNYQKFKYPQKYGNFTPFVSGLDLVTNCGKEGFKYIASEAIDWKDFIKEK